MATYPGMSLGGEVRESVSLDEDDLSDVEDEVFIRDGKNSYKLAEELNVKRPLMAPRRKLGKPEFTSRLKARPPCKAFCKPCCYIFAALSVLIGLIVLVVILVSIFPLPLDRLRDWLISRSRPLPNQPKLLSCSDLRIKKIWTTSLPVLTTESPVTLLDLNHNGVDDILLGFGTGDNYKILPSITFCQEFYGVPAPCQGGVVALNGSTGDIIWRYWLNDTIFSLHCTSDLNQDGFSDCLAVGTEGSLVAINSRNGSLIWKRTYLNTILVPNFIKDQNNDSISDILMSHTRRQGTKGRIVLISGKTGRELRKTSQIGKTFFMPQLINSTNLVLIGTGGPNSAGNLSATPLKNFFTGNLTLNTIYRDNFKGMLTQSLLVDITGDLNPDIITSMYNSTVVAMDGVTFDQIWNFTVPNSESNFIPTPAYFNGDNVTDFLVVYQKYDNILNYNYTQSFIIDGKTGQLIYEKPIGGTVGAQMGGLTLSMEDFGFDMFLFWTAECKNKNSGSPSDLCHQFNSTMILKLNALNQNDQPPGFEIYNSENSSEIYSSKSILKQIREYFLKIKIPSNTEDSNYYSENTDNIQIHKYGQSNFRHKDNKQGIIKEFSPNLQENYDNAPDDQPLNNYYADDQPLNNYPAEDADFNQETEDTDNMFKQQMLYKDPSMKNNRDPRSKSETNDTKSNQTKKKNLSEKSGVYEYGNIKMSKNRLLHDLNNYPNEILLDTFLKNREDQLRKSRFEQRDITSHIDKQKDKEELMKILEKEKKTAVNTSYTLWDLESEKEMKDKESGYWRSKRSINQTSGFVKISSVGAVLGSSNSSNKSIDVVFVTYWTPKIDVEEEIEDCVQEKLAKTAENGLEEEEQKSQYIGECRNDLDQYFDSINKLEVGQITVHRMRIECICNIQKEDEKCAKFLPKKEQSWPTYLGAFGDGVFRQRN